MMYYLHNFKNYKFYPLPKKILNWLFLELFISSCSGWQRIDRDPETFESASLSFVLVKCQEKLSTWKKFSDPWQLPAFAAKSQQDWEKPIWDRHLISIAIKSIEYRTKTSLGRKTPPRYRLKKLLTFYEGPCCGYTWNILLINVSLFNMCLKDTQKFIRYKLNY